MGHKKSLVWKYFKLVDTADPKVKKAKCMLCGTKLSYCRSTTSLKTHVVKQHGTAKADNSGGKDKDSDSPIIVDEMNEEEAELELVEVDINVPSTSKSTNEATVLSEERGKKRKNTTIYDSFQPTKKKSVQKDGLFKGERRVSKEGADAEKNLFESTNGRNIKELFQEQESMTEGNPKSEKITAAIVYMVAKDNLPFRSVEGAGFRKVMRVTAPFYKVPDRKKIAKLLDEKYEELRSKMQKIIDSLNMIALTTDIWKEEYTGKSYISLTGHYIDTISNEVQSVVLGTEPLETNHTSNYIENVLNRLISEWSIERPKIGGCAADNGANVARAVKDLLGERRYIPCFTHTLNLVVSDALEEIPEVQNLVKKVKSTVTYIKKNVNASDKLKSLQVNSGLAETETLKVIQDIEIRWNSTLDMLERFSLLSGHINNVLAYFDKKTEVFEPSELALLQEIISLLKPCKEATNDLSGEKYATASSAIPAVTCMTTLLQSRTPKLSPAIALKEKLLSGLKSRFLSKEKHRLFSLSTFLDPRFKNRYFQDPTAALSALNAIKALLTKGHKESQPNSVPESPAAPAKEESIWDIHEKIRNATRENTVTQELGGVPLQLRQYLAENLSPASCNPFKEWETNLKFKYPELYKIALQFLPLPGTSVASERLFSVAGKIITPLRTRLKPSWLHKLLFLKCARDELWGL